MVILFLGLKVKMYFETLVNKARYVYVTKNDIFISVTTLFYQFANLTTSKNRYPDQEPTLPSFVAATRISYPQNRQAMNASSCTTLQPSAMIYSSIVFISQSQKLAKMKCARSFAYSRHDTRPPRSTGRRKFTASEIGACRVSRLEFCIGGVPRGNRTSAEFD